MRCTKSMRGGSVAVLAATVAWMVAALRATAAPAEPAFIPWPVSVQAADGTMMLQAGGRIVAGAAVLRPLAEVLAEEIAVVAGVRLAAAEGRPAAGDIGLELDDQLRGEEYVVEIGPARASVRGGTYGAVAMGTVTLLQAIVRDGDRAILPCMTVTDRPQADYRGLMIDVARKYHTIAQLQQMVVLCRLYKIRYLQLHLTDDQSFMFPSQAYPALTTKNRHGGESYTLEELRGLVRFADARGVTIVPEFDVPGHSGAAIRAMRDLLVIKDTKPYEHHASINFVKPEVMTLVETVVGEMCDVFESTPYFHIGGDEADLALAAQNVDFKAAMAEHSLPNQHELYRRFVVQMNDIVKKRGKKMLVWEGFGRGGKVKIPTDVTVMSYEMAFYQPNDLVRDGYAVVNASWTPLYVVNKTVRSPEEIYAWNMFQFKKHGAKAEDRGLILDPTPGVIGAQMCSWEQPADVELPSLRQRLAAMSERVWNPAADRSFADFSDRLRSTDAMLSTLTQ